MSCASTILLAGGGFNGESRGVFGTFVEEGSLVGAAIKMFSPTSPRRIGGISSATDQLRVRVLLISNCQLDTGREEELRPVCKLFVNTSPHPACAAPASVAGWSKPITLWAPGMATSRPKHRRAESKSGSPPSFGNRRGRGFLWRRHPRRISSRGRS